MMIKPRLAMLIALGIAIVGMLFSGFLSYRELFLGSCQIGFIRCGSGGVDLGMPACVYGLIMYTALVVILSLGLRKK